MMHIIPAIDVIGGQCVRLTQGDYLQKKIYAKDPVAVARKLEQAGLQRLHLVDLDGAKEGRMVNGAVLKNICTQTRLKVDFGGGVRSDRSIDQAFAAGAAQITAGSVAVKNKEMVGHWIKKYGAERIILGADVKNDQIAINGWQEGSGLDVFDFIEAYSDEGIRYVVCTDVSRDGLLQEPSVALYQRLMDRFPGIKLIASGGVASRDDLRKLEDVGVYGAIVGKAIYEEKITLEELKTLI